MIHINDLNDDCLKAIFSRLSLKDQFESQRVCKLWNLLMREIFEQQTSVRISEFEAKNISRIVSKLRNLRRIDLKIGSFATHQTVLIVDQKCRKLTSLILSGSQTIDSSIVYVISKSNFAKQLTEINISKQRVCDQCLTVIAKECKALKTLNISHNNQINGTPGLQHLGPTLTSLDISECRYIREDGIRCLVSVSRTALRQLTIGTYVSKPTIECIASQMLNLRSLSIDAHYYPLSFRCEDLSVLSRLKLLTHLSVRNLMPLLENDFDTTLCHILSGVSRLRSLSLIVAQISDRSLVQIQRRCPSLETFEYQYSDNPNVINHSLTIEGLSTLRQLPRLNKLRITGISFDKNSVNAINNKRQYLPLTEQSLSMRGMSSAKTTINAINSEKPFSNATVTEPEINNLVKQFTDTLICID